MFAPEVRKVLTQQVIEEARATIDVYTCVACGRSGHARIELASVLVIKSPNFPQVMRFAHVDCASSHVVDGKAIDPSEFPEDEVTFMKVAFQPGGDTRRGVEAMLLIDRRRGLNAVTASGEPTALDTQFFLSEGFGLALAIDQQFPEVADYTVHISPDRTGYIDHVPGRPGRFLEHFDDDDPAGMWYSTVRSTGWITVITGKLGIAGTPPEHTQSAVENALRSGNVVGGRIRVIQH
ncbi:hypothetical protein AWC21_01750 [Mycolicibacterium peregrinum]|nr:hypothetical protein AWC21_01750 [Mycolicibacterium peregrinum]